MANFNRIVIWLLQIEDSTLSGVVKNLNDGMGRTRFGIAEFAHKNLPPNFYTESVNDAVRDAETIYRNEYWNRICGDQILDDGVASCLMSFGVNDGDSREIEMLQQVMGFQTIDGIMGPVTLAATNRMNPASLAAALRTAQANFYKSIVARQPTDARFLDGWLKRANLIFPSLS